MRDIICPICDGHNKTVLYRSSHHRVTIMAKGGSIYELAAELYGRADGCSGGLGGSVHITASDVGFIASSAILGVTTACAVGSALASAARDCERERQQIADLSVPRI